MKSNRFLQWQFVRFNVFLFAGIGLLLTMPGRTQARAQDRLVTIKLKNESGWRVTAKLVGPTPKAVRLNPSAIHRFRVTPGDYYLFYHYVDDDQKHRYLRTDLFAVKAGSDEIAVTADSTPYTTMYGVSVDGYHKRVWLLESDFAKPPGWPATGVPIESQPTFNTLKLLVVIQELDLGDRDYERNYVTSVAKGTMNRLILRDILPQLRRQGFRVAYAQASAPQIVPETFAEPTLIITYNEQEGRTYMGMKGISIKCELSLYLPGSAKSEPAWRDEVWGVNSDEVRVNFVNPNGSFRSDSLNNLKAEFSEFVLKLSGWKAKP